MADMLDLIQTYHEIVLMIETLMCALNAVALLPFLNSEFWFSFCYFFFARICFKINVQNTKWLWFKFDVVESVHGSGLCGVV